MLSSKKNKKMYILVDMYIYLCSFLWIFQIKIVNKNLKIYKISKGFQYQIDNLIKIT